MAMFPDLEGRTTEELRHLFAKTTVRAAAHDENDLWLQDLAVRIAQSNRGGVDFLLENARAADQSKLRAILLAASFAREKLSPRKRDELCALAKSLLQDRRPLVVAEAVDTLASLKCALADKFVARLIRRRSPYVVGSALRYLAHVRGAKAVPVLLQGLDSPEPIVRQNAVDELDELNYKPAVVGIHKLLKDPDPDVREAARSAVAHLQDGSAGRNRSPSARASRPRSSGQKHPRLPSAGQRKKGHSARRKGR